MGFFDRFRRPSQPEKLVTPNAQPEKLASPDTLPDAPLVFQDNGFFEVASCPGEYALKHLEELCCEGHSAGFTAIMLGGKDQANNLVENREDSETSPEEYLRLAAGVNVEHWLKERVDEDPECYQTETGDWPVEAPAAGKISAHLEVLSGKPKRVACLAKIPTARNWEVPAYIGMGGWNACPDAAVLTAFAKRWHELYDAEIVSITSDVIEFSVKKPPVRKEAALTLAREQYVFCSDIVDQGVGSISALAATLLNSHYWYFWWD